MWDPAAYLRFTDHRSRPFDDLLARIAVDDPAVVVDLGCGPGTMTLRLAARWPQARISGLDSSVEMISAARALGSPVRFDVGDVTDWDPAPDTDVVTCNAVLQWVPGHPALLERWAARLRPGAVLAVQVPGNFDAPAHQAIRSVATDPRWRDRLSDIRGGDAVLDPAGYAAVLLPSGCAVDAWETTYLHLLPAGDPDPAAHPVLAWVEGTAARPVRAALDDDEWALFRQWLGADLALRYPIRDGLVAFAFRRVFVVATRTDG
ncbi:trans-aconitate 2-methyltransferase [Solwaraspora sp. WMMD406]|uniref:trans-aconitate 2-methyltransferase n=1 Tax=Solwaraspora sp. WMMD406 TaxID=3016095 RepID=UPI0024163C9E|nr:trans-aconitate 2-methyltransferase [Solwaraspora sp. WMMD406]MDG4767926.1 trans-aconitate 2-methyltransferase [Solwaraspora sp. WMMD406]